MERYCFDDDVSMAAVFFISIDPTTACVTGSVPARLEWRQSTLKVAAGWPVNSRFSVRSGARYASREADQCRQANSDAVDCHIAPCSATARHKRFGGIRPAEEEGDPPWITDSGPSDERQQRDDEPDRARRGRMLCGLVRGEFVLNRIAERNREVQSSMTRAGRARDKPCDSHTNRSQNIAADGLAIIARGSTPRRLLVRVRCRRRRGSIDGRDRCRGLRCSRRLRPSGA